MKLKLFVPALAAFSIALAAPAYAGDDPCAGLKGKDKKACIKKQKELANTTPYVPSTLGAKFADWDAENVEMVLDEGFWAGMTLYPETKCTPQRAADIIETYGDERIWINSAGDWGHSDPLAVPKARHEMARRGHASDTIAKISFGNPKTFLSQSAKFKLDG